MLTTTIYFKTFTYLLLALCGQARFHVSFYLHLYLLVIFYLLFLIFIFIFLSSSVFISYSSCMYRIILSFPLHFEHMWLEYLLPISLEYLVNNFSEINPTLSARVVGRSSSLSSDKIHIWTSSISSFLSSLELE